MRLLGLVVVGLALIGAQPAVAQYYVPRPAVPIGPPAASDVSEIVEAMGLDPLGQPMRSGPFYVQRATDDFGRVLSVTVDARRSQVVAIEPTGAPGYRGPYAAYGGPYGRRLHPMYGLPEADVAPPRSITAPQAPAGAPQAGQQPKAAQPAAKSAAVTPNRPPVPRKRPAAAAQESAGSVESVAPAQASAPDAVPQPSAPQTTPARPAAPALSPVTPLE